MFLGDILEAKKDSSCLGATAINEIGEVRLSDEIVEEGFEILKRPNFITIRYLFIGRALFQRGVEGVQKIWQEAEILGIFFN